MQFEELESAATEDEIAAEMAVAKTTTVVAFTRKRPARKPFPEHLPRERVIVPGPTACLCCGGGRLRKLGESVTDRQRSIVLLTIGVTVAAEHIRHFRARPSHWLGRSGGRWCFRFGVDGKSRDEAAFLQPFGVERHAETVMPKNLNQDMAQSEPVHDEADEDYRHRYEEITGVSLFECPVCRLGRMTLFRAIRPLRTAPSYMDTS